MKREVMKFICGAGYREWLQGCADAEKSTIARLIDAALRTLARARKMRRPPRRLDVKPRTRIRGAKEGRA